MRLTVLRTGPLTVLKDAGRIGHAALGVAPSGAVDRGAYLRANRLVGNPEDAAVLECTLGGLRVRFDGPAVVALTGSDAVLLLAGQPADAEAVVRVPAGVEVAVSTPRQGLRSYLAVRGGFDVRPVLGSRSTGHLAGLGPPRLTVGDTLPIGAEPAPPAQPGSGPGSDLVAEPRAVAEPAAGPLRPVDPGPLELAVDLGPRDDWFTADAIDTFLTAEFVVAAASDAVGLRLDGPVLTRRRTGELPSEGVVRGSVQVPPDGHPIVFQADHPVTGGYPVVAVLTPAAADLAAQARPGRPVRFRRAPGAGPADDIDR